MNNDKIKIANILGPISKRLYRLTQSGFGDVYPKGNPKLNLENLLSYPFALYEQELKNIISKLGEIAVNPEILDKTYEPGDFGDAKLTNGDKKVLMREIEEYNDELTKILNFSEQPTAKTSKQRKEKKTSAGRPETLLSFNYEGKEDQLEQLYLLEVDGIDKGTFIDNSRSSTMEQFIEIFKSKNLPKEVGQNIAFHCSLDTRYIAFIFNWLEKNGNIKNSYLTLGKIKCFYSAKGTPITTQNLRQAKGHNKIESFKPDKIVNVDEDSKPSEVFNSIHHKLKKIFPKRAD